MLINKTTEKIKFIPLNPETIKQVSIKTFTNEDIYVFDIDKTLYLPTEIKKTDPPKKYSKYLNSLGYNDEDIERIEKELRMKYGKPIEGLIKEYNMPDEIYKECIKINKEKYEFVKYDEEAVNIFKKLKGLKICFTNASAEHSKYIIERLGLTDYIDFVFHVDFEGKVFLTKPSDDVFRMLEACLNVTNKNNIHFFDDKLENIEAAKRFGWNVYHVDNENNYKSFINQNDIPDERI